jgi:hypothetical protein
MNTIDLAWKLPFSRQGWTEPCTLIIEHFGLPGDKYTTELTENNMKFHFKDNKDALMCRLLISEYQ